MIDIEKIKSRGPKTDPWGTHLIICEGADEWPSIHTHCVLSTKHYSDIGYSVIRQSY